MFRKFLVVFVVCISLALAISLFAAGDTPTGSNLSAAAIVDRNVAAGAADCAPVRKTRMPLASTPASSIDVVFKITLRSIIFSFSPSRSVCSPNRAGIQSFGCPPCQG